MRIHGGMDELSIPSEVCPLSHPHFSQSHFIGFLYMLRAPSRARKTFDTISPSQSTSDIGRTDDEAPRVAVLQPTHSTLQFLQAHRPEFTSGYVVVFRFRDVSEVVIDLNNLGGCIPAVEVHQIDISVPTLAQHVIGHDQLIFGYLELVQEPRSALTSSL